MKDAWIRQERNPRKRPKEPVLMYSAKGAPGTFDAEISSGDVSSRKNI